MFWILTIHYFCSALTKNFELNLPKHVYKNKTNPESRWYNPTDEDENWMHQNTDWINLHFIDHSNSVLIYQPVFFINFMSELPYLQHQVN